APRTGRQTSSLRFSCHFVTWDRQARIVRFIVFLVEYFVIGPDGKEYGPATVETLLDWVKQDRIRPTTLLKESGTNLRVEAAKVPGLFSTVPVSAPPVLVGQSGLSESSVPPQPVQPMQPDWSQSPSNYNRNYQPQTYHQPRHNEAALLFNVGFRC